MKKSIFILLAIFTGVIIALNTGCKDDPKETCEQDEICEGEPEVTLCCTDGADCYWTYNGTEYPDTDAGLDQLYDDLGCASTAKSALEGDSKDYIMAKLLALRDRVVEASKR